MSRMSASPGPSLPAPGGSFGGAASRLVPTLSRGDVVLRAPVVGDLEGAWEQCQDPVHQRWTSAPVPYSREDARTFLGHIVPAGWETEREWAFVVQARDDDGAERFAGTISLRNLGDGRAEIAYGSHPWVRGRGAMERALRLLLEWGFAERDLQSVVWLARRGNWASRRLAWRLGFDFEGTLRDWLTSRDGLVDAWVGTLRRGEPMEPRGEWLRAPTLSGGSVVLRGLVDADLPRFVEAADDPGLHRYSQTFREGAPHDEAKIRARDLEHLEESAVGLSVTWVVADAHTDDFLGSAIVYRISPGRDAEIGYWTHPDARGRGVATEACGLAAGHAFAARDAGGLGLRRLSAYAAADNPASHRVLERSGFTRTGIERRSTLLGDGTYVDTFVYDRLAGEPPTRRS
jgi:RimJ/RimL family protein N-acetyltransferase